MRDNELMHYGVLGMKWGRRKQRAPSGIRKRMSVMARIKKRFARKLTSKSKDIKNIKMKDAKKRISDLSDSELQRRINRLNLERTYETALADRRNRHRSRTSKFVGKAISRIGDGLINKFANDVIPNAVVKALFKNNNSNAKKYKLSDNSNKNNINFKKNNSSDNSNKNNINFKKNNSSDNNIKNKKGEKNGG